MIRGKVNHRLQAQVTIDIIGRGGRPLPIEVILDTGFSSDLLLQPDVIEQLDLTPDYDMDAKLANGQQIRLKSWLGTALWHGQPRQVLILESDGEPLLGTNLLRGNRVTLDVRDGGDVVIEES